jgi:predicted HAD superfamily Cof-like phosphohydrolase
MSKVFTDVGVFMAAAGQTTNQDNQRQSQLYKKLIEEETQEFWEAEALSDDVEEIDACFDMMWVIVGYMKSRGWDCDAIWDEGAKSNLSKIDPLSGKVIKRDDGKVLKPEGWQPPNFAKFVKANK